MALVFETLAGRVGKVIDLDNVEELVEEMKQGNAKYLLVNVVSRRVRAYARNEKCTVDFPEEVSDPIVMTLAELHKDKLKLVKEEPEVLGGHEESERGRHEEEE